MLLYLKIEHIAIWARDIEKLRFFYETNFNAQCSDKYINPVKKFSSYFLRFDSGARLEIMQMDSVSESNNKPGENYFGIAHLAISVGSRELVDQLAENFKKSEYTVLDGPRTTGDGYYETVILDPEGNRLEITI